MVTSQLLLLTFVGYWLLSEYKNEEAQLKKDLTAELRIAKDKVADSILIERFVNPMMLEDTNLLTYVRDHSNKGGIAKSRVAIYTSDSAVNRDIGFITRRKKQVKNRIDSIDKATVFVSSDSGNIQDLDSNVGVIVIREIYKLLAKELIKDSLFKTGITGALDDKLTTQYRFQQTLDSKGWHFTAKWTSDDSIAKAPMKIFIKLEDEKQMSITGYRMHLLKAITPQILFTLLLVLTTAIAFWMTNRSLRRQMKLSDMKNGLISNMSHELKTPVSTVKVALEALDSFDVVNQPDKAREYIHMAMLETHRLELLVNKALNTSLMEQGKMTLQRLPHDLKSIVQEIVDALKLRLEQNETTINLHATGDNFIAKVDKLHVQGAVMNIIDNSIKYGNKPVAIDINIIATDASIRIELKDNGPGIPPEYIEQVFEKFFRVPDGDKHNIKGYGLGLSYVQQVMQLHKGMTQVSNASEGGCVFTLQFFRGR